MWVRGREVCPPPSPWYCGVFICGVATTVLHTSEDSLEPPGTSVHAWLVVGAPATPATPDYPSEAGSVLRHRCPTPHTVPTAKPHWTSPPPRRCRSLHSVPAFSLQDQALCPRRQQRGWESPQSPRKRPSRARIHKPSRGGPLGHTPTLLQNVFFLKINQISSVLTQNGNHA